MSGHYFKVLRQAIGVAFILGCCVNTPSVWAVGDSALGKKKTSACVACHGPDGNSTVSAWPKLAGQHASYLTRQMLAFKQGKEGGRYEPSMTAMMAPLSEQDIINIAAYYAGQKTSPGVVDQALVARGQQLYRGGNLKRGVAACSACHGPQGLGNADAAFPKVSGQHADYIVQQLRAYRDGVRKAERSDIMHDIAMRMTVDDMQAVASYMEGLY